MGFVERRRFLLNVDSFPGNYIFKEGKGLKKDYEYFFGLQSSPKCYLDKKEIYLEGLSYTEAGTVTDTHSTCYIGSEMTWNTKEQLISGGIDVKKYSTIYFDCFVSDNSTRECFLAIINPNILPNESLTKTQDYKDNPYWQRNNDVYVDWIRGWEIPEPDTPIDSTGRYTWSFDISDLDEVIISLWSPDWNSETDGKMLKIYNIWLE